jgi:hypothetical protein
MVRPNLEMTSPIGRIVPANSVLAGNGFAGATRSLTCASITPDAQEHDAGECAMSSSMFELRYEDRRGGLFKDYYEQWRIDYLAAHPPSPIDNVRFEHNPDWRRDWLSIQHTRNDVIVPMVTWYVDSIKVVWYPLEYGIAEFLFVRADEKSQAHKLVRVNATGPKLRPRQVGQKA